MDIVVLEVSGGRRVLKYCGGDLKSYVFDDDDDDDGGDR
jgi:hypothetical protein